MYSICDPVYSSDILKVPSDLKKRRPTYLPNLILMGRSIANKDIFKDGLTVMMLSFRTILDEPRHDKTNKMNVRPAKTQISPGIHPV